MLLEEAAGATKKEDFLWEGDEMVQMVLQYFYYNYKLRKKITSFILFEMQWGNVHDKVWGQGERSKDFGRRR